MVKDQNNFSAGKTGNRLGSLRSKAISEEFSGSGLGG